MASPYYVLLLLLLGTGKALAAAGDVDAGFGYQGFARPLQYCCGPAHAHAAALQQDGKIVAVGGSHDTLALDTTVARWNADGNVDATFGKGGVARIAASELENQGVHVAIAGDGGILVLGYELLQDGSRQSFLLRLTPSGAVDAAFASGGIARVTATAQGVKFLARSLVLQPDGKVLLGGEAAGTGGAVDMAAMRFLANGTVDTRFGNAGLAVSGHPMPDRGFAIAVGSDGAIVVGGEAGASTRRSAAMRLLPDGTLDASFASGGVAAPAAGSTANESASSVRDVRIEPDGSIFLASETRVQVPRYTLFPQGKVTRLLPSGAVDKGFGGGDGESSFSAPAVGLGRRPDGSYSLLTFGPFGTKLYRFTADGTLLAAGNHIDIGRWAAGEYPRMAMGPDGSMFIPGNEGSVTSLRVVKMIETNARQADFEAQVRPGWAYLPEEATFFALDAEARIYAAGRDKVQRLTAAGLPDASFGPEIAMPEFLRGLWIGPDAALLVATWNCAPCQTHLRRVDADGSVSPPLASIPGASSGPLLRFLPDGRFFFAHRDALSRFLPDGRPDTAFNLGTPVAGAHDAAVLPDGGVATVSGKSVVRRYSSAGGPAGGFGFDGSVDLAGLGALALDRVVTDTAGRILVAGILTRTEPARQLLVVARLFANGSLDGAFGAGGIVEVPGVARVGPGGIALQADGKILLGGTEHFTNAAGDITSWSGFVARLKVDGSLDETFSSDGFAWVTAEPGHETVRSIALRADGSIVTAGGIGFSSTGGPFGAFARILGDPERPQGAASLVRSYYSTILGRSSDPEGQAFWEGEVQRMRDLGLGPAEAFHAMAGLFFTGPEYAARNRDDAGYVSDLYRTFFVREPDSAGLAFWVSQIEQGKPRAAVLNDFLFSAEFAQFIASIFGPSGVRAELAMVADFYRGLLGRLPDTTGFSFWVGRFRTAQCNGNVVSEADAISADFLGGAEYGARDSNRTAAQRNALYVVDLYGAFLKRGSDLAGFQFWVDQLNSGARTREQVRQQFVAAPEFQERVRAVQQAGCSG